MALSSRPDIHYYPSTNDSEVSSLSHFILYRYIHDIGKRYESLKKRHKQMYESMKEEDKLKKMKSIVHVTHDRV